MYIQCSVLKVKSIIEVVNVYPVDLQGQNGLTKMLGMFLDNAIS